jgi:hypothetical protein
LFSVRDIFVEQRADRREIRDQDVDPTATHGPGYRYKLPGAVGGTDDAGNGATPAASLSDMDTLDWDMPGVEAIVG